MPSIEIRTISSPDLEGESDSISYNVLFELLQFKSTAKGDGARTGQPFVRDLSVGSGQKALRGKEQRKMYRV